MNSELIKTLEDVVYYLNTQHIRYLSSDVKNKLDDFIKLGFTYRIELAYESIEIELHVEQFEILNITIDSLDGYYMIYRNFKFDETYWRYDEI